MVKQHEAQQPGDLGLIRHQLGEHAGQTDGLVAQPVPDEVATGCGAIALVEQQVQHTAHRRRTIGQEVRGRHAEGNPGVAHLGLGPHQALGHGLLGHEKRPGDLRRRQPCQRPQREGNLGIERQRRVTAGEHQPQPVIDDAAFVLLVRLMGGPEHTGLPLLGRSGSGPA
jgi:hypothetical protein